MPIYLDRHDMVEETAEGVAGYHLKDVEVQKKYGVKFLTYWYDADRKTTFCLVDAPDKETADKVHAEAHGLVANNMIEVDLSAVEAFLGRVQDPPTAISEPIDDTAFRAIMFTDIVGSTEMTARLGDTLAVELLRAHDAIIRRSLEESAGREVKHLGDGIMASFDKIPNSVTCALGIQREFSRYNEGSSHPVQVRIGLHAGEPVEESNDLFGSAVQTASRICDAAQANKVLLSREIADACKNSGLEFKLVETKVLKGISDPVDLYSPD